MTKAEKQEFGEAGNISLASASGAITGDFCEIRCIGSTTFTALVDTLERTTAEYGNKASGLITFAGLPVEDETFVVRGITYTFKAAASLPTEITIGADAAATAANAAAEIAANDPLVTTSVDSGFVTVTAVARGTAGNAYTLTESATNVTVSGAGTLAGGTNLATAASLTYPDGHILRGKFTTIHLAGGNARVILSSALPG